jgi:hypothetical protein
MALRNFLLFLNPNASRLIFSILLFKPSVQALDLTFHTLFCGYTNNLLDSKSSFERCLDVTFIFDFLILPGIFNVNRTLVLRPIIIRSLTKRGVERELQGPRAKERH